VAQWNVRRRRWLAICRTIFVSLLSLTDLISTNDLRFLLVHRCLLSGRRGCRRRRLIKIKKIPLLVIKDQMIVFQFGKQKRGIITGAEELSCRRPIGSSYPIVRRSA